MGIASPAQFKNFSSLTVLELIVLVEISLRCKRFFLDIKTGFFSTSPKKLKDEKTQNSRKKLKTEGKN